MFSVFHKHRLSYFFNLFFCLSFFLCPSHSTASQKAICKDLAPPARTHTLNPPARTPAAASRQVFQLTQRRAYGLHPWELRRRSEDAESGFSKAHTFPGSLQKKKKNETRKEKKNQYHPNHRTRSGNTAPSNCASRALKWNIPGSYAESHLRVQKSCSWFPIGHLPSYGESAHVIRPFVPGDRRNKGGGGGNAGEEKSPAATEHHSTRKKYIYIY